MARLKLLMPLYCSIALSVADPALTGTAAGPLKARPDMTRSSEIIAPAGPASTAGRGDWTLLAPSGSLPTRRRETCAIYDELHDRMVVFGGLSAGGALNDTWVLNFGAVPAWSQLQTVNTPTGRASPAAIYDPVRKRMLVFGGNDGSFLNEVMSLALDGSPVWEQVQPAGPLPTPRNFSVAAYDAQHDRMVVFGGLTGSAVLNDVWALSLGDTPTWEQIMAGSPAPSPRYGAVGVYDAFNDRMIVSGGVGGSTDSWALSLSGTPMWTQLSSDTGPTHSHAAGIYDPGAHDLVVYGGSGNSGDTWQLALDGPPVWTQVPSGTGSPPPLRLHAAVYRGAAQQMVIFGGYTDEGGFFNDTWAMELAFRPFISGFDPPGGPVGTLVSIHGFGLSQATSVKFGGVEAVFTVQGDYAITATVPAEATTGPVSVTTPDGTRVSRADFFVGETPEIIAASPNSGKVGTKVILAGLHFTGATRVAFGPASHTVFTVDSDEQITTAVDSAATTGPVSVTTPAGTGTSSITFTVVPPDTSARIVNVRDVRADQGGRVAVRWLRSDLDVAPRREIAGYRVWRRAPLDLATTPAAAQPTWRREVTPAGEVEYWEPLTMVPASYLEGYAFVAPTTRDSIEESNPYAAFFIQTLTADPFVFYNSAVDSGYSVDNLPPRRPRSLTAEYRTSANRLHWGGNFEPDLREYRLYRGDHLAFVPGADNLIYAGLDTMLVDTASPTGVYKLSAVDIHGNESRFALATPTGSTTGVAFAVTTKAEPTSVTLDWYVIGLPSATMRVYRRTDGSSWQAMATVIADAVGMVRYRDEAVQPGQHLGYRLGMMDGDVEVFSDETWVTVPEARLALLGIAPNPVVGDAGLKVRLSLPQAAVASLQVVDISGRVVARQSLRSLGAGIHEVRVAWERQPSPGIYWVRLTQGGRSVAMKVGVLR